MNSWEIALGVVMGGLLVPVGLVGLGENDTATRIGGGVMAAAGLCAAVVSVLAFCAAVKRGRKGGGG